MLKIRCGKKHGKYCEQFINQVIRMAEHSSDLIFDKTARNIFEFLAFHLHYEGIIYKMPILAVPPGPYLKLKYPKTIVIEPWGVLVYRKNEKLVIRAHTGKFLAEVSDGCNLIFWTELMPKDADIITSLLPIKDSIHWLYRYHCCTSFEPSLNSKKLKVSPYVPLC